MDWQQCLQLSNNIQHINTEQQPRLFVPLVDTKPMPAQNLAAQVKFLAVAKTQGYIRQSAHFWRRHASNIETLGVYWRSRPNRDNRHYQVNLRHRLFAVGYLA